MKIFTVVMIDLAEGDSTERDLGTFVYASDSDRDSELWAQVGADVELHLCWEERLEINGTGRMLIEQDGEKCLVVVEKHEEVL